MLTRIPEQIAQAQRDEFWQSGAGMMSEFALMIGGFMSVAKVGGVILAGEAIATAPAWALGGVAATALFGAGYGFYYYDTLEEGEVVAEEALTTRMDRNFPERR